MRILVPLLAGLLAACGNQPAATDSTNDQATAAPPPATPAERKAAPDPVPSPVKTVAPAPDALANTAAPAREVVSEAPFTATSAQGAANVVQTYFALIEAKKYGEAYALWQGRSGLSPAAFAAQFANYRDYHAEVYKPGAIEGAAGSLYVQVPIKTYGMTIKSERFEEPAVVTLRRVNDVDGSTAEQRRWHIQRIDTPPSPH